jgi:hypothetical protein
LSFILYALGFVAVQVMLAVFVGRFIRVGMGDKQHESALRDDDSSVPASESDRSSDRDAEHGRETPGGESERHAKSK